MKALLKTLLCALLLVVCCVPDAYATNRSLRLRGNGHCRNDVDDIQLENALLRAQLRQQNRRLRSNRGFNGGGNRNVQLGLINFGR